MNPVEQLRAQAPQRFAPRKAAAPHEPLEILRMNITRYQAMLASPEDGEHRRQIERVLLDYETALSGLQG